MVADAGFSRPKGGMKRQELARNAVQEQDNNRLFCEI